MSEHKALHKERKGLHKDWRTWVALVAMLAAIGAYVMSLDDSDADLKPPPAPASGAPANP